MSLPPAQLPLVDYLKEKGYSLATLTKTIVSDDPPMYSYYLAPVKEGVAEEVLIDLVSFHGPSDLGVSYLEEEVAMLEEALQAIRARIEGEYDHPALLRAGALGDKDADILRIIDPVLND